MKSIICFYKKRTVNIKNIAPTGCRCPKTQLVIHKVASGFSVLHYLGLHDETAQSGRATGGMTRNLNLSVSGLRDQSLITNN